MNAPFPLTDLQQGYLVGMSDLLELGGFRPHFCVELDVVGFDAARAEAAFRTLIRRHDQLRTVVLADGTGQRVVADDELTGQPFRVVDLTHLDRAAAAAEVDRIRAACDDPGIDPTHWPLFELVAIRLREHRTIVHLAMSLLLLDSRSTRLLLHEWRSLYADPAGEPPGVTVTYRDAVLALQAGAADGQFDRHLEYWRDRLDTLPDAPRLPTTGRQNGRLRRRTLHLDGPQWKRLCAAFRRRRVLPTAAMLHLFAETLGRWADTPSFCLNVLHQGWAASRPAYAGVVGQLSATLPVEVDLAAGGDFWERAATLQRRMWQDLEHGDVTAVRVMRERANRRGWNGRAALPYVFNSMLGPQDPAAGEATGRTACRMSHSALRTPQVLVDNQVQDAAGGGVLCVWDVLDEAFPPGLPDLMFDAYRDAVLAVVDGTGAASTATGGAADRAADAHDALVASLNTVGPVPGGRLEDGFLRNAAVRPDAPAVIAPDRTLTYGELAAESAAVAAWLSERRVGTGSGRDDLVPVVLHKGWRQVVAVLGVLRAGAAYCPVDAGLPAERVAHLVGRCGASPVLDEATLAGIGAVDPGFTPPAGSDPRDLAYVIHTSGSTGQPKGVMIDHRGAVNTVVDINARIGLTPGDRVFGISSLSFDLSVWDVFGTLAAGAALVLPAPTAHPEPAGWVDLAVRTGVTVWNSVPALAQMLAEAVTDARPPVRAFLLSGDWIPTSLPDRLRDLWPAVRIVALGGATEASIWSNVFEVTDVDPAWPSIPYGVPLTNQTMRVLDHDLEVRRPWAVGRIYIGGAGVALGYWRDAERTAERFLRHPRTGEDLYWTGDLGRYWPDGTIEFLGREDRQLKIQGFRVEPGEIEAAVRDFPGVRECVVTAEETPTGQRRLAAVVVGEPDGDLVAHLRGRLAPYMVPARVAVVDRIPLTANGKVDLAAAIAGATTRPAAEETAGGPVADLLRQWWSELLNLPDVPADGDFFALGGNSLLALRLVNRVRSELGVQLPLGRIFEASTLPRLTRVVGDVPTTARCAVLLADRPGTPLTLFHPVGGSTGSYVAFARHWPGPVLAFQSHALAGGSADRDLIAMASRYRDELRERQPDGPYLLGGWSMGGVIAFEVGRQLRRLGEDVSLFAIDSALTPVTADSIDEHQEFLKDLADGRLPATLRGASDARRARDGAVAAGLLPAEVDVAGYERLRRIHSDNLAALRRYRPAGDGPDVLLLLAERVDRPDPVPAWRAVSTDVVVETFDDDHYSIVTGAGPERICAAVSRWYERPPVMARGAVR